MKVWVKLLAGSLLGLLLGFLLPVNNPQIADAFSFLSSFALGIGRYTAVAAFVFSLIIGIYELKQDGKFWSLAIKTIVILVLVSAFVIGAGMLVCSFFPPDRIPILTEQSVERFSLQTKLFFLELFPPNMLSVAGNSGLFIFPVCIFAFFFAIGLSYDKNYTKQIISICDSLSRIFYHITAFFSEILGVLIIVLSAYWAVQYQGIDQKTVFLPVLRLLLAFSVVMAVVVMPVFLYFVKKYKTPWKVVYASIASGLCAFFSGDINFSLPVFIQQSKENLGVRRRANTVITMLWTTFGRSGSAAVAVISLLVIIKSYSSLDISSAELFGIGFNALLISLVLARNPGDGAFAALAALCAGYGHGLETGYLILKPAAFFLISVGTFLDIMIASIACFAIARLSSLQTDRETKSFI